MFKRSYLLVIILLLPSMLKAVDRYGLVIGNENYKYITRLWTPRQDTFDEADVLRQLGFKVDVLTDATYTQMVSAMNGFISKLKDNPKAEAVFIYNGHAVSLKNGTNYLLPVDLNANEEADIERYAYHLGELEEKLNLIQRSTPVVMIIDGCRGSPYQGLKEGSRGYNLQASTKGIELTLSYSEVAKHGIVNRNILALFSTSRGMTALDGAYGDRNSPFASAVIKTLGARASLELIYKEISRETYKFTAEQQLPSIEAPFALWEGYSLVRCTDDCECPPGFCQCLFE
ncbi:MAG: caspase family protein [Treponema sp.]|jgi:hypothetical protein|nr:caspase family protein [Treponema sp.]